VAKGTKRNEAQRIRRFYVSCRFSGVVGKIIHCQLEHSCIQSEENSARIRNPSIQVLKMTDSTVLSTFSNKKNGSRDLWTSLKREEKIQFSQYQAAKYLRELRLDTTESNIIGTKCFKIFSFTFINLSVYS